MFFQEAPPDTSAYMIAGYAVFFVIGAIYLLSLFLRQRNLEADLSMLETIEKESPARRNDPSPTSPRGRPTRKKAPPRK